MGFCDDDMWKKIISCSQAPIIDGDFLQEFASYCRNYFDQESKEIHYQDVPQSALKSTLAEKIVAQPV